MVFLFFVQYFGLNVLKKVHVQGRSVPSVVMLCLSEVKPGSRQLGRESLNLLNGLVLVRGDARVSAPLHAAAPLSASLPCHATAIGSSLRCQTPCMLFGYFSDKTCSHIILFRNKVGSDLLL